MNQNATFPMHLTLEGYSGGLQVVKAESPLSGATGYHAESIGDGLEYRFPAGALADARYLTADFLLEGTHLGVFQLALQEGESGPSFHLLFGLLNQCSARMRMPLEATNLNRWRYEREGAWLKPMCGGDRVRLSEVDRLSIRVIRKSDAPVRWFMTPLAATADEPPLLDDLILPKGFLLDAMGQNRLTEWKGKTPSVEALSERLRLQSKNAGDQRWPENYSRWGGWRERKIEATGFFQTHHDGKRWWLVDPDGHLFWSAGMDCVRVDTDAACDGLKPALEWVPDRDAGYADALGRRGSINYLAANFIREFGPAEWYLKWSEIAYSTLCRLGINTVANWSDWQVAKAVGFPYVRPLDLELRKTPMIYRDFPDVFHPSFQEEADARAEEQLRETADDPALIGYFLMNEPTWGFSQETPAAGMLYNAPHCETRRALGDFLKARYATDAALATAWGMAATFAEVSDGVWTKPLTDAARADLAEFSGVMAKRLFEGLSDACKKVDPHHLNLGARYYTVPPAWAVEGMRRFDVFSMNCYRERAPEDTVKRIADLLGMPVMIGEWHFGALDAGLPGSGIGHVKDQAARGQAYRFYVENAAAQPDCIGVHYFTLYDESALGRFDGENWNIGFIDVCNKLYEPLAEAARLAHERMYAVASGDSEPFNDPPEYLPLLFL
jgi:hypothetical protein